MTTKDALGALCRVVEIIARNSLKIPKLLKENRET
jgi:hypothetical protein